MRLVVNSDEIGALKYGIVSKLQAWQDELIDDDIIDGIVYETLDSVIDLVINEVE